MATVGKKPCTKHPALFMPISTLVQRYNQSSIQPPSEATATEAVPPSITRKGIMTRAIGRLHTYNILTSRMWIQDEKDPSMYLVIDTSRIEPFSYKEGSLFQFIGELDEEEIDGKKMLVLRTLLYRCVEGLDMDVYLRAHAARVKELNIDFGL